jgi:hypothetical protein
MLDIIKVGTDGALSPCLIQYHVFTRENSNSFMISPNTKGAVGCGDGSVLNVSEVANGTNSVALYGDLHTLSSSEMKTPGEAL